MANQTLSRRSFSKIFGGRGSFFSAATPCGSKGVMATPRFLSAKCCPAVLQRESVWAIARRSESHDGRLQSGMAVSG